MCVCVALFSVVVEELLDATDIIKNRITRGGHCRAVRPALIALLTPFILLPLPIVLGTKV